MRVRAERHDRRGDVEGLAAVLDQPHMVEPRAVADRQRPGSRGPDRPWRHRRRCSSPPASRWRALPSRSSERVNIADGRGAAGDMDDMQRLRRARRRRRPRSRRHRSSSRCSAPPWDRNCPARTVAPAARRRRPPAPRAACGCRGPFRGRRCRTVSARTRRPPAPAGARPRSRAASGRRRRASAPPHPAPPPAAALRASARADRCISSPRSAGAAGLRAHRPRTPAACSSATLPAPGSRSRATAKTSLSARPVSVFANTTFITNPHSAVRPRLRTARSRKPRAPAPVPCRRSSPRGPSTSRARSRARCSSAAADNA